ncbi:MAG: dienelactone hydrolase family protein [Actinomycetota bacterium]
MTKLQRYLAEEIAVDHADGIISRREALRRLGLLGLTVMSATALLAACAKDETPGAQTSPTPTASSTSPAASPAPTGAVATQAIEFPGSSGRTLMGAWAAAAQPKGGVLVIHENRGLTDHIRSVAGRFAGSGYSAIALDLLSEEGGTASLGGEAEAMAALNAAPESRFVADMKAGLTELGKRVPGGKLGQIGFCFGGAMTWLMLNSSEKRLAAAAPFYGTTPDNPNFSDAEAAVLGVYAELDSRVNATRDEAMQALRSAGLTHEIKTYPGVDHAFFNDTGARYNATQARRAYQDALDWFGTHLG